MSAFHLQTATLASAPHARRLARHKRNSWLAGTALGLLASTSAHAGVTGAQVVQGAATVNEADQQLVTINQTTSKAVINWATFTNSAGQTVQFTQPDASSITLNRVTSSSNPSVINGSITANGQVWLLNPYGVAIGSTGTVNVKGFVGTTHAITDADFMNGGDYTFTDAAQNGPSGYGYGFAEVINEGMITVGSGYAILAGREVRNGDNTQAGGIFADLGSVVLAGVPTFTLALDGDKLLSFAVSGEFSQLSNGSPLASNIGNIQARGGRVLMSARATSSIVDSVVNMGGNIDASTARVVNGVINLGATSGTDLSGSVTIDGGAHGEVRIDGSQMNPSEEVIGGVINVNSAVVGEPGTITVLGNDIRIGTTSSAKLLASATEGSLSSGALANGGTISIGKGLAGTDYESAPLAQRLELGNVESSNFDPQGRPIVEIQARAFGGNNRVGGQIFLATDPSVTVQDGEPTIVTSAFIDVQASGNFGNAGGSGGMGGAVQITTPYFKLNPSGTIIANSVTQAANGGGGGRGGTVAIAASRIETEGDHTYVPNADPELVIDRRYDTRISASGNILGGNLLLGGGLNGAPAVPDSLIAREIWIGRDTSLRASAADLTPGSTGGNIIIRTETQYPSTDMGRMPLILIDGGISARGGNGGHLETISHRLRIAGRTDPAEINSVLAGIDMGGYAPGGANGTWLAGGRGLSIADSVAENEGGFSDSDMRIDARVVSGALNASVSTPNGPAYGATNVRFTEAQNGSDSAGGLLVTGNIDASGYRNPTLELIGQGEVGISGNILARIENEGSLPGKLSLTVKAGHVLQLANEGPGAIDTNGGNLSLILGGDANGPSTNGLDRIENAFSVQSGGGDIFIGSEYASSSAQTAVAILNDGAIFSNGGLLTISAGNFASIGNSGIIDASFDSLGGGVDISVGDSGSINLGTTSVVRTQGGGSITLTAGDNGLIFNDRQTLIGEDNQPYDVFGTIESEAGDITITVGGSNPDESVARVTNEGEINSGTGSLRFFLGDGSELGSSGALQTAGGDISISAGTDAEIDLSGESSTGGGSFASNTGSSSLIYLHGAINTLGGDLTIGTGASSAIDASGTIDTVNGNLTISSGETSSINHYGSIDTAGGSLLFSAGDLSDFYIDGSIQTGGGAIFMGVGDGFDVSEGPAAQISLAGFMDSDGGTIDVSVGDHGFIDIDGNIFTQGGDLSATVGTGGDLWVGYFGYGQVDAGAGDAIFTADDVTISYGSSEYTIIGNDVRINAETIDIFGSVRGENSIAIAPRTVSRDIVVGGSSEPSSEALTLYQYMFDYLAAPTVVVGRADGTGTLDIDLTEEISSFSVESCGDEPCPRSEATTTILQVGGAGGRAVLRGTAVSDENQTVRVIAGESITLAEGLDLDIDASRLELVSNGSFVNQAGASALRTSNGGQWLVYSAAPANNGFGGLLSEQSAFWGQSFTSVAANGFAYLAANGLPSSGNRYLFGMAPTLTIQATSRTKTYGDTIDLASAVNGVDYVVSSVVDAAAFGNVFAQDMVLGAPLLTSAGSAARADVGQYGLQLASGSLSIPVGYNLQLVDGTLTINPRTLSASLSGPLSKVYDGTTALSLGSGSFALTGIVAGDEGGVIATATGSYADKNAGTGKTVTGTTALSGSRAGNYVLASAQFTSSNGVITPKVLQASVTASNKVYDGTTAATGTVSLSGVIAGDVVGANGATLAFADKNAGTGKTVAATGATLVGADAGNYALSPSATGTADITPRQLTASLTGSVQKVYDATTAAALAAGNYAIGGFVAGEGAAIGAGTGSYASPNVGSGLNVTASLAPSAFTAFDGTSLSNYLLPTSATGAVGTITPATLTYLADSATRAAGAANPAFSGNVTGFVGGETQATATSGTLAFSSPATVASTAGSYAINGGGLTAGNYVFVQAPGNATALTVTGSPEQMQPVQQTTNNVVQQTLGSLRTPPPPRTPTQTPPVTPPLANVPSPGPNAGPPPAPPPPPPPVTGPNTPSPNVDSTPPSPVGDTPPPTPSDAADEGDPVLAEAETEEQDEPTQEKRQLANTTVVVPGVNVELPTPPRSTDVPGADQAFSGSGNPSQW